MPRGRHGAINDAVSEGAGRSGDYGPMETGRELSGARLRQPGQVDRASRTDLDSQSVLRRGLTVEPVAAAHGQAALTATRPKGTGCDQGPEHMLVRRIHVRHTRGWRGFRILNVVDDFNRGAVPVEIDLNLPTARVFRVHERFAPWCGYPEQLRLDNGSKPM